MDVAVIGGGLAGLAAGSELRRHGLSVTLYEATDRIGGQIDTVRNGAYVVELGADSVVTLDPAMREFLATIDLTDRLVSQSDLPSLALEGQKLTPLPKGAAAAMLGLGGDRSLRGKGVVAFKTGMAELNERLVCQLGPGNVELGMSVTRIARQGDGWSICSSHGEIASARAVVVATPPPVTAKLINTLDSAFDGMFPRVPALSSVAVSLAFPRIRVGHPLDASGYVVPCAARAAQGFKACTFTSSKFPGRCPVDHVLLRAFYRPGTDFPIGGNDTEWIDRATAELRCPLEIAGPPTRGWVSRWPDAIYNVDDKLGEQMSDVSGRVRELGTIELAGSGVDGVGVHRALNSGCAAAHELVDRL
ncbi:MAG: protoporphyrinogen/coproporphyrinogen oxidase [Gemmatimonadales bacterium]